MAEVLVSRFQRWYGSSRCSQKLPEPLGHVSSGESFPSELLRWSLLSGLRALLLHGDFLWWEPLLIGCGRRPQAPLQPVGRPVLLGVQRVVLGCVSDGLQSWDTRHGFIGHEGSALRSSCCQHGCNRADSGPGRGFHQLDSSEAPPPAQGEDHAAQRRRRLSPGALTPTGVSYIGGAQLCDGRRHVGQEAEGGSGAALHGRRAVGRHQLLQPGPEAPSLQEHTGE
ncbi:hypothetical protein EYF80_050144 [Liparis tanakae]|uniref:Uncharacterized protein n=1 Tax=Liparis tanakae TaxID=230148 RepID=A0A4Z2FFM6_9TELE|nr:hypothetical protein EYF80_050144 [Liparis tanakae]